MGGSSYVWFEGDPQTYLALFLGTHETYFPSFPTFFVTTCSSLQGIIKKKKKANNLES